MGANIITFAKHNDARMSMYVGNLYEISAVYIIYQISSADDQIVNSLNDHCWL